MTERDNQPTNDESGTDRRKAERFHLDYATWRDHLAAPGSQFDKDRPAPSRAIRIDAVSRPVDSASAESERRAA